jgi:alanine racemase
MSGLLPEEADAVVEHSLTPVVWTIEQLEWLTEATARQGNQAALPVHLEVDTGMARQGAAVGVELNAILSWLSKQSALYLDGVMTHFASAEVAGSQQTLDQRARFEAAMTAVAAAGLKPTWVHAGNSSTVDNRADGEADSLAWLRRIAAKAGARAMVRPGLGLYGYALPIEQANGPEALPQVREGLQPVMCWKTRVIGIRNVQPGDTVGYNATFVARTPMKLALLPVGYADGLRRELSSAAAGGWVMVQGQRAAIVGRVSMNLTVVNVTGLTNIAVGDEVVLLGDSVTAEDHARLAGTMAYEIVCGVRSQPRLVP